MIRKKLILVVLTVIALRCASGAVAQGTTFTPELVAKLRSVTGAVIAPNGEHIAYLLRVPRTPFKDEDGPPWVELHVVDRLGASRPYVTGEVEIGSIDWTPDGKSISFIAQRGKDEHESLYTIPIDGGEARRVVALESDIEHYSWNGDGTRVAVLATEPEAKEREDREEKGLNQTVFEEDDHPVRVWIADVSSQKASPRMLNLPGSANDVRWSPIGSRLAVALAPTPRIDDEYMNMRVHVVDAEEGSIVAAFETGGKIGMFRWSPDRRRIALIAGASRNDPSAGRLMVVDAEGGALQDVLPGYLGEIASIAWQGNDTVMYLGDEGVWTAFGEVRFDGSERKVHVSAGTHALSDLALSRDGQSASLILESPEHPAEVAMISHADPRPRRLTTNNPWLSETRFAAQEWVRYTARDGVTLEGILIRPLDEQAGEKYPLILTVHGGPEAHYRNGWVTSYSNPGQVAAARGFAVFYPNYRGGTGRGVAFSMSSQGDYGGAEFDDLIDSVDYLVGQGLVDVNRVGVTGGSYGGYASAWCATYFTQRFAASVMAVGVSDWLSDLGTTDIPEEMYLVHARHRPWENWQRLLERSPIFYVQQARTPILIMHGLADTRVGPGQSMELYRHLKTIGKVPVRLVLYPKEGHGNRNAASRYDYHLRMLQWFEHYLKGAGGDLPPSEPEYPLAKSPEAGTKPPGN